MREIGMVSPDYYTQHDCVIGDLVWTIEGSPGTIVKQYPPGSPEAVDKGMQEGGGLILCEGYPYSDEPYVRVLYDLSRLYKKDKIWDYCLYLTVHDRDGTPHELCPNELREGLRLHVCYEALAKITAIYQTKEDAPEWLDPEIPSLEFNYFGMSAHWRYPITQQWASNCMRKAVGTPLPPVWVEGDLEILKSHRFNED